MSGEILFLAHRMPFPPDRGDKIRSFHVLKHLAGLAPVHVATFAETEADLAHEPRLVELASSHCLVRRSGPLVLAGAKALLAGEPVSLSAFRSSRFRDYVRRVLSERPITAIYVFSGQMGQYVPADFLGRVILDFVDVDSAKFEAFAAQGTGPRAWIDRREGRLLRAEETRLALRADCSLFVSDEEAALFAARLCDEDREACDIRALRNGIDCGLFDPGAVLPEPRLTSLNGPRLIFTGQMGYAPNIAAAERAMTRLLPRIRTHLPNATLHIVGRKPPRAMIARHGIDCCHIWGEVPDMRPWLRGADLALVPLDIARGVQNKVLEAMAMELPVVLTPGAAAGIGARDGEHLAIAESDDDLIARVIKLASEPTRARAMGQRARRFVCDHLSWAAALEPLAGLIGGDSPAVSRHAG